ncbi:peptidase A4 family-domain-containing protein [Zopfochytrium polystomum]|nr:peptidase A4 family-domain-containing protein [Zopfochytrium polystomum]
MPPTLSVAVLAAAAAAAAAAASATAPPPIFNGSYWAGPTLVRTSAAHAAPFTSVSATIVLPSQLRVPEHPASPVPPPPDDRYTVSAWVGLDGWTGDDPVAAVANVSSAAGTASGLWQAGVEMSVYANGTTEFVPWYEWVPLDPVRLPASTLSLAAGDELRVLVQSSSDGRFGNATLTNVRTGQSYSQLDVPAPQTWRGPTWIVDGRSAEWIVENATDAAYVHYVFPDWGVVRFRDAVACAADGRCVGPDGGVVVPFAEEEGGEDEDKGNDVTAAEGVQVVITQVVVDGVRYTETDVRHGGGGEVCVKYIGGN